MAPFPDTAVAFITPPHTLTEAPTTKLLSKVVLEATASVPERVVFPATGYRRRLGQYADHHPVQRPDSTGRH